MAVSGVLENQLREANEAVLGPIQVQAMIDTGATGTVIQQGIAGQLGLQPIGTTKISTPSSSEVECHEYACRFLLPNNVMAEGTAIEAPLEGQQIQALLGRDLLQHAVFVYIGYAGAFSLSF